MADRFDDSLFEETPYQEMDDTLFEDVAYSTEEQVSETPELKEDADVSMLESTGRGLVQGATMGLGEEVGAAALSPLQLLAEKISKLVPGTPENVDEQLREAGFAGDALEEKDLVDTYKQLRDTAREANKDAEGANPGTYLAADIAGGALPAILSGGGAAAAKIAGSIGKEGLKQSMKEGAKLGAKYGAASGYGYGEGETLQEDVEDTALGAVIGAGTGGTMPLLSKGAVQAASKVKSAVKGLSDKIPGGRTVRESFKYGMEGKALDEDLIRKDMITKAKEVLGKIGQEKEGLNLKEIRQKLDDLGIKIDAEDDINRTLDDLKDIVQSDDVNIANTKLVDQLKQLAGVDVQGEKLLGRAEKSAVKKVIESGGEYQPRIKLGKDASGRPTVTTEDLSSGKITAIVGDIDDRVRKDLNDLSVVEVEDMIKDLNAITKLEDKGLKASDAVTQKARQLASKLRELSDKAVQASGDTELVTKKARLSDVLSAEDLLGTSSLKSIRPEQRVNEQARKLASRLGSKESIIKGDETAEAVKLLGKDIVDEGTESRFDQLKYLKGILDTQTADSASLTGVFQRVVTGVPNVAGRATQAVTSPVRKVTDKLSSMGANQYNKLAQELATSPNEGMKMMGQKLIEAADLEGPAKQQLLWSLSQNPAFRQLIERQATEDAEMNEMLLDTLQEGNESEEEGLQTQASVDITDIENTIDRLNGQQSSGDRIPVGQLDDLLGKIASLGVSQEQIDELENDAVQMDTYSEGLALKEKLRSLMS